MRNDKELIKKLLIESKNDPRKLLELEKHSLEDVIEVGLDNGLYEQLMLAFQPVTIDGETRICLDAFSSNILLLLDNSYDSMEDAEQRGREKYEEKISFNRMFSGIDSMELDEETFEEFLSGVRIIPREVKAAFKKVLFTPDFEQISKIKIKNSHARTISGVSNPINSVEDVMIYSEPACLMTCIDLFNKNIMTTMNDTMGVIEDKSLTDGVCMVWIDYNSLDQENRELVEKLIACGCAERFMHSDSDTVSIFVPCLGEETIGEVSNKLMAIASRFKVQEKQEKPGIVFERRLAKKSDN